MAYTTVGKINSSDTRSFQWTIDNFILVAWRRRLESPIFRFSDAKYRLFLTFTTADAPLTLCCRKICNSPFEKLNVELRIRTGCRGNTETHRGKMDVGKFAVDTWMASSEFWQKINDILKDGHLTVFCELSLDVEENASVLQEKLPIVGKKVTVDNEVSEGDSDEEETSTEEQSTKQGETSESDSDEVDSSTKWKTIKKMQKDFKNLLTSGEDSDVTIKVQGKEFPAHRNILRSRSPVFKCMLSHDTVEKQSGVLVIDDCDPDTFPVFLKYLYTGSTKHISNENVFSLYTASVKYGVEELKEECGTFMKSNMSVGTFCDTFTLALRHTEKELVDLATRFFCENGLEIIETEKWQTFLRENSTACNLLFKKLLLKNN